jgi:hypothetical protein
VVDPVALMPAEALALADLFFKLVKLLQHHQTSP